MKNQEKTPFIKRLENGTETKMLLLSHNSFWTKLQICERKYDNLELEVFGENTAYFRMRLTKNGYTLPDCDFIIYYSSSYFYPDELAYLKKIASQYSINSKKRVTVGYSFVVPENKRKSDKITDAIEIYSIKDGIETEVTLDAPEEMFFSTMLLTDIVTELHEFFEKQTEKNIEEQLVQEEIISLKKILPFKND